MKSVIKSFLKKFDLALTRYSNLQRLYQRSSELERLSQKFDDIGFLNELSEEMAIELFSLFRYSKSQIRQDLFVLSQTQMKERGYFVEFGATNGVSLSNTWLLEKNFGWTGILAEPAIVWHEELFKNRSCHIENKCVWSQSGIELVFNQTPNPDMSTLIEFSATDHHAVARNNGRQYSVSTISINDLLDKYEAPKNIDYLSIDTEGSEFEILKSLDFEKYAFNVITCEHNFSPARAEIKNLLISKNYKQVYSGFSMFDDWYIKT